MPPKKNQSANTKRFPWAELRAREFQIRMKTGNEMTPEEFFYILENSIVSKRLFVNNKYYRYTFYVLHGNMAEHYIEYKTASIPKQCIELYAQISMKIKFMKSKYKFEGVTMVPIWKNL